MNYSRAKTSMPEDKKHQKSITAEVKSELGSLYVFEGPNGAGKSTLAALLTEYLNESGLPTVLQSFPGNDERSLGNLVYRLHHAPETLGVAQVNATSLQLLHVAAHIDVIESTILPTLRSGSNVVLDRYWWSTLVYGRLLGAERETLEKAIAAELVHWQNCKPRVLFLIRRQSSLKPEGSRGAWETLSATYDELSKVRAESDPIVNIDNNGSLVQALSEILKTVFADPDVALNLVTPNHSKVVVELRESLTTERPALGDLRPNPSKTNTYSRLSPAVPTKVYESYWTFAAERQEVFFRRLHGAPPPWTQDPILESFKFTNAYRASDRVSQYLIRNVIYSGDQNPEDMFFRILLFKTFNKIETWELLQEHFTTISYQNYDSSQYDRVLTDALASGKQIYSAAYIMASGKEAFGEMRKHRNHLKLLEMMMEESLPSRVSEARSMVQVFELLKSYPTIGDFLGFQYAIDLNYSPLMNFSEMDFVMAGPGAKDGIRKCFSDLGGLNDVELIKLVAERQIEEFKLRDLEFKSLWGRPLQLIDCQNLFCEVSKYARVAHPEVKGVSDRTRIKQVFRPRDNGIKYWYPPKWGINEKVERDVRHWRCD